MENRIACPACGVEQSAGAECAHCGLIYAKYKTGPRPEPPKDKESQLSRMTERYKASIGTTSRLIRWLVPFATAAVTALLVLNGALGSGFQGYLVVLVLGTAVLYYLLSNLFETISLDRFYTEGILFVFLMLGVRLGYPAFFDTEAILRPPPKGSPSSAQAKTCAHTAREMVRGLRSAHARGAFVEVEELALKKIPYLRGQIAVKQGPERLRLHKLDRALQSLNAFLSKPDEWGEARAAKLDGLLKSVEEALNEL